jgi:F1F0 ATPase subunit 2
MMIETGFFMLISGSVLGLLFFVGLWYTVKQAMLSNRAHRWFILSFALRMTLLLAVFFFISKSAQWQDLACALIGFVITRSIFIRMLPTPTPLQTTGQKTKVSTHAS